MGTAPKRVGKELSKLANNLPEGVHSITPEEDNILHWTCKLLPTKEPYNCGAFDFSVDFPEQYPFAPPKITFITKILHPNFDENGEVCLQAIDAAKWKPATKMDQVFVSLRELIENPEPDHPLRTDLAEQFVADRKSFEKHAKEHAKKHALQRP
eukprot:m.68477 g.68477  ORF g.68477 m.68477 type:complete len:154 (+) comp15985_c0_seq1:137-598(+)